jgi:hypothetical protein
MTHLKYLLNRQTEKHDEGAYHADFPFFSFILDHFINHMKSSVVEQQPSLKTISRNHIEQT